MSVKFDPPPSVKFDPRRVSSLAPANYLMRKKRKMLRARPTLVPRPKSHPAPRQDSRRAPILRNLSRLLRLILALRAPPRSLISQPSARADSHIGASRRCVTIALGSLPRGLPTPMEWAIEHCDSNRINQRRSQIAATF